MHIPIDHIKEIIIDSNSYAFLIYTVVSSKLNKVELYLKHLNTKTALKLFIFEKLFLFNLIIFLLHFFRKSFLSLQELQNVIKLSSIRLVFYLRKS